MRRLVAEWIKDQVVDFYKMGKNQNEIKNILEEHKFKNAHGEPKWNTGTIWRILKQRGLK